MQRLPHTDLLTSPIQFIGALDFDRRPMGISPRRLPAWTRPQVPQPMDVMLRMPAGVRLAFRTNSATVTLEVQSTNMVMTGQLARPVVFDLEVDGEVSSFASTAGNQIIIKPAAPGGYEMKKGEPYAVTFSGLGTADKFCQLWLPHNAFVELRAIVLDSGASLTAPPASGHRWVHYGSSISHCMEAEQPTGTWPAVASRLAGMSLHGLGFGGQCHLDPFVARTIRDLDVDLISIKTGINVVNMDSMRERTFIPALHGFLDTIREKQPDTPIIVTSPIFCPCAEDRPGPTVPNREGKFVTLNGHEQIQSGCLTLTRIRHILQEVVMTRSKLGDRHLGYVDGLDLFGKADAADLPDDLHPNPAGYRRMGERFAKIALAEDGLLGRIR
jgi:hypothetical protein